MVSVIEKRGRPKRRTTPFPKYDVVARTFLQERYNTERWNQMITEPVRSVRPFWMFDAILDNRTTHVCQVCNQTLLPWDDIWWQTHKPPIHWGCRSIIRCVSRRTAGQRGVSEPPRVYADLGFGTAPKLTPASVYLDPAKFNSRLMASAQRKVRVPAVPPMPVKEKANVALFTKAGPGADMAEARIMSELDKAGFNKFYSERGRKLDHFVLTDNYDKTKASRTDNTVQAGGIYYSQTQPGGVLKVLTNRQMNTVSAKLMSKDIKSMLYISTSPEHTASIAAVHEFGHGVHMYEIGAQEFRTVNKVVQNRWKASDRERIGMYADGNEDEYFAEAFACRHFELDWMKKNAPKALEMVEEVMRLRGLL